YGWWVFCGALAAMTSWSRPNLRPWIEGCAVASTGLVWLGATQASAETFMLTNAAGAAAYLSIGWRRSAAGYLAVGWTLACVAPLHMELAVLESDHPGRAAVVLGLLVATAAFMERRANEHLAWVLGVLAHLTAAGASLLGWVCLTMADPAFGWGVAAVG